MIENIDVKYTQKTFYKNMFPGFWKDVLRVVPFGQLVIATG